MGFIQRTAHALRTAAARVFGPRPTSGSIVVIRKPDRRDVHQLPMVNIGAWDRRFEEVQAIITAHEQGQFRASAVLADTLDRNPRIVGALNNRCLGVVGAPFSMLEGLGDKRRAAKVARLAEEDWPLMCPEETAAEVLRWLCTMGFAIARQRVVSSRGRWVPVLECWHPSFIRWDIVTERFMALTYGGEVPVVPGEGWVLFATSHSRPWMRGVVRCLGLPSETRGYAVHDWRRWSEKHGLPIVELKVPASKAESDETEAWFAQMQDLRSDTTVVSPQGDGDQASYGVNLIEARDTAWEGFKELIARQDGDVSIAIEGQNLSTENSTVGAKASSQTGHTIRQDLREADAWCLATALHEQLLRPWAQWNFGDADVAPWAVYDPTPPEDLAASATTMKASGDAIAAWNVVAEKVGLTVDVAELGERYGVPLIALVKPAAPENDAPPVDAEEVDTAPEDPATARVRASARRFLARRHQQHRMAA